MTAADIEVVNQNTILDVEAVARGGVAMGDQDALGAAVVDLDMGLAGVAAAGAVPRRARPRLHRAARPPCRCETQNCCARPGIARRSPQNVARSDRRAAAHCASRPRSTPVLSVQPVAPARWRRDPRPRKNPGRDETAPICRSRTASPADDRTPPSSPDARARDARTSRNTAATILNAPMAPWSRAQNFRLRSAFVQFLRSPPAR